MPEFWSNLGSIVWYTLTLIIFISLLVRSVLDRRGRDA